VNRGVACEEVVLDLVSQSGRFTSDSGKLKSQGAAVGESKMALRVGGMASRLTAFLKEKESYELLVLL